MKKTLLVLALLAAASSAYAGGSISVEREHFNYRHDNGFINGTALLGSYQLGGGFTVDGRFQWGRVNDGSSFNTGEVGLKRDFVITDSVMFSTRIGTGRMYPQGAASIPYFVIDPTVTYTVNPKLFVTAGFRVRNNYDGGSRTISPMTWADYLVTDKDMVSLGYTAIRGKLKADSATLSYTRLF